MFKQIAKDFKEIKGYIKDAYIVIVSSIKIKLLIFMANLLQKVHNRRFFVTLIERPVLHNGRPTYSNGKIVYSERLKIINNNMFKEYKRKGWMPKKMTTLELQDKSFYATPLNNNNNVSKHARKKAIKQYIKYSKIMRRF